MKLEPLQEITICRLTNGFLIKKNKEDEDHIDKNIVIEDIPTKGFNGSEYSFDSESEQISGYKLLSIIKDIFDINYNKYNKNNLVIKLENENGELNDID